MLFWVSVAIGISFAVFLGRFIFVCSLEPLMNRKKQKPYNFVEDYGLDYTFGAASETKVADDHLFHSILKKYLPHIQTISGEGASTEESSSESDSDEEFPEPHHCRIYSCNDPECSSCERANECQKCSHCGINKSLLLPCLDCNTPEIHSKALHHEVRCPYHTEFPAAVIPQFTVSLDSSKVVRSKFIPLQPSDQKSPPSLITDKDKLAEYVAQKEKRNDPDEKEDALLQNVLGNTYSQCQISPQCLPTIDLNVDTSRFFVKPFEVPKDVAMPPIMKRPDPVEAKMVEKDITTVVNDKASISDAPKITTQKADQLEGIGDQTCHCYKQRDVTCAYPRNHLVATEPECVLCSKAHENPCKCYKHQRLLEEHKMNVNETMNVLIANHTRACFDVRCPLRSSDMQEDTIAKWFNTLVKLERLTFQCPLNVTDFGTEEVEDATKPLQAAPSDTLPTYITNFLPRPMVEGQKRVSGVSRMKFWDRLSTFHEQFTDHTQSSHIPLLKGISKPIFQEDDVEITGRYDDIYAFWDRNKHFTTKKILVKTPETLVKLIEVDDLPLKFEALHALNKAARLNRSLQESLGQKKVIVPLLNVLDHCEHDGTRRLAIYLISMALRFPPGRCVFFELGPDIIKNLYKHYLTDQRYAMRRAYMLLMSNLLEDTGACAILCNAVNFENTFANMCENDPDLQLYLMKMMYFAMHDIEGREKITALPEFRLTPILSGCLSKRSRIRETALNLLDAIVSFCKQDVVIRTFKDVKGIKVLGKILRKAYMAYAHPTVLKIYEQLAEDPEACLVIKEGSLANLVEFVDTVDDPKLIGHTLRVLVKMARDPLTKEVLALTNVITKVAPLLLHTNEELAQPVLMILELMAAKGSKSLITQQLVKADPMVDLLWVVGSENRGWDTRVIALRCIIALLNLSPYFGECFIKCKNSINVVNLLCHQAKFLTTYSKTLLVQVLSALSKSKRNYEWLIRNKTIKALLYSFKCFDSFESQLYAHSVGLLAFMMKDRRAVIQFSNVKNSWNLLAKKFMEKKFISADILMNLMFLVIDLTDNFELAAKSFMNNGFLKWMIDLEEIYPEMSGSIRNAIDSIIRNYLPLQFAHHGFLSYQDYTNKSLFFVTKKMYNVYKDKDPFPMFDKGISSKLKPEKPIYYFNLPQAMRGASSDDLGKQLQIETSDNFELYSTVSRSADSVHQSTDQKDEETFIQMEQDANLSEIYEQVKTTVAKNHDLFPPKNQREKRINEVMGIATVIQRSMMGYDPLVPVTRQIQDIYMDSMKKHLGTNIFPIGRLVMGYKFERAVLFKLLADVLDIPCWLTRNGDVTAWVEVYVPPEDGYHGGELTRTFLLDLMSSPPKLLPPKSTEAKEYLRNVDY